MHRKDKGFTLIEILLVVAIISILLAMIVVVGGQVTMKAQIANTKATILALAQGCEQYKTIFARYPDLNPPTGVLSQATTAGGINYPPAGGGSDAQVSLGLTGSITDANFKEWNKRLRYIMEEFNFVVDEVRHTTFVKDQLPKVKDPNDNNDDNNDMYSDAWVQFIRICPGRNHSTTDNVPPGPNNLHPNAAADPLNASRANYIPDIYSIGPDGNDQTDKDFTTTQYDANDADDVVHWFIQKLKSKGD